MVLVCIKKSIHVLPQHTNHAFAVQHSIISAEHDSGLIDHARIRIAAAEHDPPVLHAVHHGVRVIDEEIQFVHQAAVVVADRILLLGHAATDSLRFALDGVQRRHGGCLIGNYIVGIAAVFHRRRTNS